MSKNKKSVLFATSAIVLMIGGGLLLYQTVNVFYYELSALAVISLLLLSMFLYVAGASLIGQCIRNNTNYPSSDKGKGIVFALLLIAVGLLLLGFNTGNLPLIWKKFFFSWPVLVFIIGAINIIRKSYFTFGIIAVAVGAFFSLSKVVDIFPDSFVYKQFASIYWPALIIVLGVLIIVSIALKPKRTKQECFKGCRDKAYGTNEDDNKDGKINYRLIFSGTEQVVLDPVFKGGNINITFGGMELDLRRTFLPEGDTFLHVKATFGGVEITAPESWDIEVRSNAFLGGVDDSRNKDADRDKSRRLIIVSQCTFGGLVIQ